MNNPLTGIVLFTLAIRRGMIIANVNNKELSPCIRNCCLDENDICVGCYRHILEIIGWQNKSTNQRKLTVREL